MTKIKKVQQRAIVYVSGFDPRGAGVYHSLTMREFSKHCKALGIQHRVSKRSRKSGSLNTWSLDAKRPDDPVHNDLSFLGWDGLVRNFWVRSDFKAILVGAGANIRAVRHSVLSHLIRINWPSVLTFNGPVIIVAGCVVFGLLFIQFLWLTISGFLGTGLIGLIITGLAGFVFGKFMAGFNAPWIGRINRFFVEVSEKPVLANWDAPRKMANQIVRVVDDPNYDEILIVSHSVGCQIALLALAEALKKNAAGLDAACAEHRLVFLTMGHTISAVSRSCNEISTALQVVGESKVPWLDISSPSDPACFALVDPYRDRYGGEQRVHVRNARFYLGFADQTYRRARKDRYTMHFLYLMTPDGDRKEGFDLYDFLTSTQRLADRLPAMPEHRDPYFSNRS